MFAPICNGSSAEDTFEVGADVVEITSFVGGVDLRTTYGAAARRLIVASAGSGQLAVTTLGANGTLTARVLTGVWDRFELPVACVSIQATTNVSKLWVIF